MGNEHKGAPDPHWQVEPLRTIKDDVPPKEIAARIRGLESEAAALRAENERLRETYRLPDENHCRACGEYMPLTLDGDKRIHDCDRTPPLGNLPPTIYVCPTCRGHAPFCAGCWGTKERPHPHVFMVRLHEAVLDTSDAQARADLAQRRVEELEGALRDIRAQALDGQHRGTYGAAAIWGQTLCAIADEVQAVLDRSAPTEDGADA